MLSAPAGLAALDNGTIFLGDGSPALLSFSLNSRRANQLTTLPNWVSDIYVDNRTSLIYLTLTPLHLVQIWPTNATIPPNGITGSCNLSQLYQPSGIVGDSLGNIYVASRGCSWVTKWAPNASNGTLIAGSSTGVSNSNSASLSFPNGLALDEGNSYLYVADQFNNRVQRFLLGGSPNGVTVVGGVSGGTALNKLNRPFGLYLSRLDGSLYIADTYNNRVQKWALNASSGTTIAGNQNGIAGNTANELNQPFSVWLDRQEKYFLVSDQGNQRVQRFSLR